MKRWWVKLSTDAADHPKMLGLDLPAFGLWAKSLCYAGRQEMEGFVPRLWVDRETNNDPDRRLIPDKLEEAGLWDATEGGWMIHNWDERQIHDADERKRELGRERQARLRERRREADPGFSSEAVTVSNVTSRTEERREEEKREDKTRTSTSEDILSAADVTADVQQVWDVYRAATNRTGSYIFNEERRGLIVAALEQYPLEDILDAVRGWAHIPFYNGENDQRQKYNNIELILKDHRHIEQMRDAYRAAHPEKHPVAPIEVEEMPNAYELFSRNNPAQEDLKPVWLGGTRTSTPPRTADDLGASRDPCTDDLPEDDWRPREPDGSG